MTEKFCYNGNSCPDTDPKTGNFLGTSTVGATVEGVQQAVTVKKDDLLAAARTVRASSLLSGIGKGQRSLDQYPKVPATTLMGEPISGGAEINGAVITSEARQVRTAQARDVFVNVARTAIGARAPRPARA